MGTNYYLHRNICAHCGRGDEPLHIGKSSSGWCFSLHVIPEGGINDLLDLERRFAEPGAVIKDEYGEIVSADEMLKRIKDRKREPGPWATIPLGYDSWDEFHRRNYSEVGPNGLLRHRINSHSRCLGHGPGTWDLIAGTFS